MPLSLLSSTLTRDFKSAVRRASPSSFAGGVEMSVDVVDKLSGGDGGDDGEIRPI